MTYIPQMYKALVPLVVAGALTVLSQLSITPDMTVEQALTLVATSLGVWLVPNKK